MIATILGWIGTATYLIAYILLTIDLLEAGTAYLGMNILAAGLVMVVSASKASWAAFFINGAWSAVSLYSWLGLPLNMPKWVTTLTRWGIALTFLPAIVLLFIGNTLPALSVLAWCSFCSYIFPYLLFLSKRIERLEFHLWNLLAATVIVPRLFVDRNWPVIAIQTFWIVVSLFGLLNRGRQK